MGLNLLLLESVTQEKGNLMFEKEKREIEELQASITPANHKEVIQEIIDAYKNILEESEEMVQQDAALIQKEKDANNSFRVMMLHPAVIRQGLTMNTHESLILQEAFVNRKIETWKDQPDELIVTYLRILECHIKIYSTLLSKRKSKSEIKGILSDRRKAENAQVAKARAKNTKEGRKKAKKNKAVSKAVRAMMKAMPHLTEAQASKMVKNFGAKKTNA